jgi:truncated hemoglobin YjbI
MITGGIPISHASPYFMPSTSATHRPPEQSRGVGRLPGMSSGVRLCTIVALSLAAACGASATAPAAPIVVDEPTSKKTVPSAESPLFERLGGEQGVSRLARAFVAHVRGNPALARPLSKTKPETLDKLDVNFATFFCSASGGGCSDVHMPESLRALDITETEWKAALSDLSIACDEAGLGPIEKKDFTSAITAFRDRIVVYRRR